MAVRYHVGTSGWHYDHWIDRFYPRVLSKKQWLDFYVKEFRTVEINGSFYRLPAERAFETWHRSAPDGFLFAVKASRLITHYRRLRNVEEPLNLFISRARLLREKLGPILYQLPPTMKRDDQLLADFLSMLPKDLRHTIEFRHSSWFAPEVFRLLESHGVALCTIDLAGFECPLVGTADFIYQRFHGHDAKYAGFYPNDKLKEWAGRIADLARESKDAFIYFNNDAQAFAVYNARTIMGLLEAAES